MRLVVWIGGVWGCAGDDFHVGCVSGRLSKEYSGSTVRCL